MSWLAWTALGVGMAVLLFALREPLAARLGWRNALRHKRQTAVVVVGLLVGTAVVSASLTTGDSLHTGLLETSAAALGETDVLVHVPGELFVPQGLFDRLSENPLPAHVDGVSSQVIARGAVEAPQTDRYEGRVPVVGFDPEEDAPFGAFIDADSGEQSLGHGLGSDGVIVNKRLADRLEIGAGDPVDLMYRPVVQPFIPRVVWANGTLDAASATPAAQGGWEYHHAPGNVNEATFRVDEGALGVVGFVAWDDPGDLADLDLELVDPQGTSHRNDTGTPGGALPVPDGPVTNGIGVGPDDVGPDDGGPSWTASSHGDLAVVVLDREQVSQGEWTLRVHAKNAVQQPFVAFAAVLVPEYDFERAVRAAERLQEEVGEEVLSDLLPGPSVGSQARSQRFTVHRVVETEGKGNFFGQPTLFLRREVAQGLFEVEDRANWLKFSHTGPGLSGVEGSDETVAFLEARLEALREELGDDPSSPQANLEATPVKQEFVERSEEAAALFTRFLALVGSFTLVAGMLLIVNLFTMLAQERRRELGVLRAVGVSRSRMVFSLLYEGGLYTLAAAAMGALVGVVVAGALVLGLNTLAPADSLFKVPLAPRGPSLLLAFAAGALLTFATVAVAAVRASRFDVASALRDEEEGGTGGRARRTSWGVFIGLGVLTVLGILLGSFLALSVGPLLVLLAAGPLLGPVLGQRRSWRWVGVLMVALVLLGLLFLRTPLGWEGDLSTVVRALLLIVAGSVFLVNAPGIPRGLGRLFSRSARALSVVRVALSYPLKRPLRTGLTVSMYSLVILVLVVFSVLFVVMTPDPGRESGGYDLVARAPVFFDDAQDLVAQARPGEDGADPFAQVSRIETVAQHREFGEERILVDGEPPPGMVRGSSRFYGIDQAFAGENGFPLYAWDPEYGETAQQVWQAVAEDPELVLVSYAIVGDPTQPRGGEPELPEVLTVNASSGPRDYRVAGVTAQVHLSGVWMQADAMLRVFPQAEGFYLMRLHEDADPMRVAGDVERAMRGVGMEVTSVQEEAAEIQQEADRVYYLLSGYLALGLVVGVASLGIVTARAVLERRRETGMLRAVGYTQQRVAAVLLTETFYLLVVSIVLGVGLGLLVARAVFEAEISGLPGTVFFVPWARILLLVGVAALATLVAVAVPAVRAGRTPPSAAIRRVD